jgi:hypothetical protein
MEMIYAIHNEPPPGLEEIPTAALAGTIARCLAKDPHDRFPSVTALKTALDPLVAASCPVPS